MMNIWPDFDHRNESRFQIYGLVALIKAVELGDSHSSWWEYEWSIHQYGHTAIKGEKRVPLHLAKANCEMMLRRMIHRDRKQLAALNQTANILKEPKP